MKVYFHKLKYARFYIFINRRKKSILNDERYVGEHMKENEMILRYVSPAPEKYEFVRKAFGGNSWENYSLPIGNGYFGANIFGRTVVERIQISEPTLSNPWYTGKDKTRRVGASAAGVNSFAEILIDVGHDGVKEYERSLSLDDACARVTYIRNGITYKREAFASYPDRVIAVRFSADSSASIRLGFEVKIPFIGEFTVDEGDGFSKSGEVTVCGNEFIIEGEMGYYDTKFKGILKILNIGGELYSEKGRITVSNADEVIMLFACDTNYELCDEVFSQKEPKLKLQGKSIDEKLLSEIIAKASDMSFDELFARHLEDYGSLYSRVALNIGDGDDSKKYTDELIATHKKGERSLYLEALLFQYGRYLLISSSRSRLPAHLQGIWNAYCESPWSCGYWHNINIQMNYWLSGPANLSETFIPYINYAKAYMNSARENADRYIKAKYPENCSEDGKNGWIIGTGAWAYGISGFMGGGHSGPGTGAFTSLLFWDHFDYTRDVDFLRDFGYPALYEMSLFFTKALVECDGKYLIKESASPENRHNGEYYHTVGCAFDQQMVYENFKRTIEAADILGENDSLIEKLREMLPHLDPVLIGDDGQVKEYREETTYSSIGEPNHRHISHLVGLYPATIINANTPEWLEGAKVTLTKRGDRSTGWAVAHRLLLWARTKTAHKCLDLIDSFIERNVHDNLWCTHPPFQIDGNFGYTAGVSEMLLQSHAGYIELLPTLPCEWKKGSFKGLAARGNFVIDCTWENGEPTYVRVLSRVGGVLKVKLPQQLVCDSDNIYDGMFEKDTYRGEVIEFKC